MRVVNAFGLLVLSAGILAQPDAKQAGGRPDARAIWRKSEILGAATPMRARLSIIVWKDGRTIATLARVAQRDRDRYRREYEAPPEARGRVVCVNGPDHWQYEPGRKIVYHTHLDLPTEQQRRSALALVESNYRILLVDERATAAGRSCYLLELRPRQPGKGFQRHWIDRQTYKTLRTETHLADGSLARVLSYQQVSLPARVSEADIQPRWNPNVRILHRPSASLLDSPTEMADHAHRVGLKVRGALGFHLGRVITSRTSKQKTLQLLYTDGLETLSVFVQNHPSTSDRVPASWRPVRINGVTAYRTTRGHADTLTWSRNRRRYTVIANLEYAALEAFVRDQLR